jgi:Protein of unknown function (DUF1566)
MTHKFILLAATTLLAPPVNLLISRPAQAATYAKVCNSGEQAGFGSCPAAPVLGPAANQWACTLDTATNLLWEIKTPAGGNIPTSAEKYFTNFDSTTSPQKMNGGIPNQVEIDSQSNAIGYVNYTNGRTLCGKNNWRRPTLTELQSIIYGTTIYVIDKMYFPNMIYAPFYWTSTPTTGTASLPNEQYAEVIDFQLGARRSWKRGQTVNAALRLVAASAPKPSLPDCGISPTKVGAACFLYMNFEPGAYTGRPQNSYSLSTLPSNYPTYVRCERPAPLLNLTAPGDKKCMRKYRAVKLTPINGNLPITDPSQGVEVLPPN